MTPGGPEKELVGIEGSPADVATHQIGIFCFQVGWGENSSCQHTVLKSGSKALNLALQPLEHIHG